MAEKVGDDHRKQLWHAYATGKTSTGLPFYDAMLRLKMTSDAWKTFTSFLPVGMVGQAAEYGCGPGIMTQQFAQKNPDMHIIAFDIEPAFLEMAKNRVSFSNVTFQEANITQVIPLDDNTVTTCGIHNWVIPYLAADEQQRFVQEMGRVHAPGSIVFGSTMLAGFQFREIIISSIFEEIFHDFRAIQIGIRELSPVTTKRFDDHMLRGWMSYPSVAQLEAWHQEAGFQAFEIVRNIMPLKHIIRLLKKARYAGVIYKATR